MQSRLGDPVKVSIERQGRIRARDQHQGVLKPGLDDRTELVPDDDGKLVFRVARFQWFALDPRIIVAAQEELDGRRLRVDMPESSFLIDTLPR